MSEVTANGRMDRRGALAACRAWWRTRWVLVAAMALTAAALAGAYVWADGVRARSAVAELRAEAAGAASAFGSSLSNAVNNRLALVRGLTAFVTAQAPEGQLDARFPMFADALRASMAGIRNISVSPDFVVRLVNPVAGNQKVIGNHLLNDPRPGFADTVRRAIETREVTTHGPLPLIQGGMGLIARQAVFVDGAVWGAVGVVLDFQPILDEANLTSLEPRYAWSIRRSDKGVVAGDPAVFVMDPIVERIDVPGGDLELAIAPHRGWAATADAVNEHWLFSTFFLGLALLIELIVFLVAERRITLASLVERRTRDLELARREADRKAEELAVAKRELEQFAYAAAHDLQEPVRAVVSYTQMLARHLGDRLDGEGEEYLHTVVEGATRLKGLLRDVQLFIAEDRAPLPDSPQPAEKALDAALAAVQRAITHTGASVARAPLPPVMADERRLREMLAILIANALEYRHPDRAPDVRIGAHREDGFDVLTVADNGIGIDPAYHERIFEVFRRLHPRDRHPGTGMGLAIARKMAERLGGAITVRSEPDKGSTFAIRLPAAAEGAAP